KGRVVASGGADLADELERTGYAGYEDDDDSAEAPAKASEADPFADPLA
ncbi:MAG: hypothetical protein JO148_02040, partial [Acidimicrobiia bacterium]|nr:hypothetical protein [Acidimicrobiia bacterium]